MRRREFLRVAQTGLAPIVLGKGLLGSLSARASPQSALIKQTRQGAWKPDGWGERGRLGLIMTHSDIEPDSEFAVLAPDEISTHAVRVRWVSLAQAGNAVNRARSFVESPGIDDAAEMLAAIRPAAIALCFTSGSYVIGAAGDAALKTRLEKRTAGIPVAITCLAAVSGLRVFGARRIALIHPPWFEEEMDRLGAEYFQHQGFDVLYHARAPLRSDRGNVYPKSLYEWALANVPREAEAVLFLGNGMRTIGAIRALEKALGKPVLTSNQVTFWHALQLAKLPAKVVGYGQVFEKQSRA